MTLTTSTASEYRQPTRMIAKTQNGTGQQICESRKCSDVIAALGIRPGREMNQRAWFQNTGF